MSLEEIKRRRMEELQQQAVQQSLQQQVQEQARLQQQIDVIEQIAKNFMSAEAVSRYGNLKAAHPEKAVQVAALIAQGVQAGQVKQQVSDLEFKNLLMRMESPKKEFKVTRK